MEYIEPWIPEHQAKWFKLIDILQNDLKLDVYPGGYSAMTSWYHRHAHIYHPSVEDLYGIDVDKIPEKLLKGAWERKFNLHKFNFFPKDLGINKIKTRGYKLRIPSLERALLEMVYDIGIKTTFNTLFDYFTDLYQINLNSFQELLASCTSEKIKRLGLFLAEESGLDYYDKLNLSTIKLNLKKKLDFIPEDKFPKYVPKYNILVPDHINWEICKLKPYHRVDGLSKRAV